MENGNLIIPADLGVRASIEGWSQETLEMHARELDINKGGGDPIPPINNEPPSPPVEGSNEPPTIDPVPPISLNFEDFGVSNYDELKTLVNRAKELEPLVAKFKPYEDVLPMLQEVENPFANESIGRLNNFIKKTGISDFSIANSILSTSSDELKNNPLKALAINEMLNDADIAKMGFDKVIGYISAKYNVDSDTTFESVDDIPPVLLVESQKAIKSIETKRQEYDNSSDLFGYLRDKRSQQNEVQTKRLAAWDNILTDVTSKITSIPVNVPIEGMGEVSISIPVTKEDLDKFVPEIKGYLGGTDPNESTVQTINNILQNRVWLEKRDVIMKEAIGATVGKIREAEIQKAHNGGQVVARLDNPGSGQAFVSPHLAAVKEQLGM